MKSGKLDVRFMRYIRIIAMSDATIYGRLRIEVVQHGGGRRTYALPRRRCRRRRRQQVSDYFVVDLTICAAFAVAATTSTRTKNENYLKETQGKCRSLMVICSAKTDGSK